MGVASINNIGNNVSNGYKNTYSPKPKKKPFEEYQVMVTAPLLNVRSAASIESNILKQVPSNTIFYISREDGNWGKLRDYDGWICLDYVKKVEED